MAGASSHHLRSYILGDFKNLKFIEEGGEGVISTGKLDDLGQVALKQLTSMFNNCQKEVELLVKNHHPNIVSLYGILWDGLDNSLYTGYVMEYLTGGSLHKHIHNKNITYDLPIICQWVEHIGRGLQFLHKQRIIHLDIKPKNILVAADNLLKLADFGVAKSVEDITVVCAGTQYYMAPEVLCMESTLSSDIYSLAITIWEIFHRELPYRELKQPSGPQLSIEVIIGIRPAIQSDIMDEHVTELIQRCWHSNADSRPQIKEIVDYFEEKANCPNHPLQPQSKNFDNISVIYPLYYSLRSTPFVEEIVVPMPDVRLEIFKKLPKEMTILLLGETGVGKSTFVNAMANYLKYTTLDEAAKDGVEVFIRAYFAQTDSEFKKTEIRCGPTEEVTDTEGTALGCPSTQEPKSYKFHWTHDNEERIIRIIDTPGLGDFRGVQRDKEKFHKILSFLNNFEKINAVCILLKPNESRLTLSFRYCINEILCYFPVSLVPNILFCFTNTRTTLYRPAETLSGLRVHLKAVEDNRNIRIPLNQDTIYCFDSESFRYLAELEPFTAEKLATVNNIRSTISVMAGPLDKMTKTHLANAQLIEKKNTGNSNKQ